ncbi:MAG: helix-hairpin-helix domain-containing protein [Defluviitaleaceae bacterium]|nr:helix-hairpin-helix domain-containing protein [Defluviitaleaceae bacterium]
MPHIWEFIKRHVFFLMGGACILIVGILYIALRADAPQYVAASRDREWQQSEAEQASPGVSENLTEAQAAAEDSPEENPEEMPAQPYIVVDVRGAVQNPGVFELPENSRVADALEIAGGVTDYADLTDVNRAVIMRDQMKIVIPAEGEEIENVFVFAELPGGNQQSDGSVSETTGATESGLVNINTATEPELRTLPGIGPSIAQNIITFRETHGYFSNIDELINVPLIGVTRMEQLRSEVTVGN